MKKKGVDFFVFKKDYRAISAMLGTVIGAGFLGIPSAISKVGLLPGAVLLIILTIATIFMNLLVSEIVSYIKATHQLPGLAKKLLGENGKRLMLVSVILGMGGALIAYTVAIAQIVNVMFGVKEMITMMVLTLLMSLIISKGVKKVSVVETYLVVGLIIFFFIVTFILIPQTKISNYFYTNWKDFLEPYGIIFFAMMGYSIIPELEKLVNEDKKRLKSVIVFSMNSVALLYFIFILTFIGFFGREIKGVATESLPGILGIIGNVLAILTMITSYLSLGLILRDAYIEDLKMKKFPALLCAVGFPLIISLVIKPTFLGVLSFTGAIVGGGTGILICLMALKVREKEKKKKNNALVYVLMALFVFGILQEVLRLI